jgi:D-glycero-D-manno-heptose 1,7-bisphosphate phosphatase
MSGAAQRPAVFVDRDGVLNALVWRPGRGWDSPYRLEEVVLLDGAAAGLARLWSGGYATVLVSNQPGYAKGYCTAGDLEVVHAATVDRLREAGATLDGVFYCYHHPDAVVEPLRVSCECRKPAPGLLRQAADELGLDMSHSYVVGDRMVDLEAARRAGCASVLVQSPQSPPAEEATSLGALASLPDLAAAAALITGRE